MVKGISRQVIVVHSPDPKLFEQAIFILRDGQQGVSDDTLLKEANRLIHKKRNSRLNRMFMFGPLWAAAGALITGLLWLLSVML